MSGLTGLVGLVSLFGLAMAGACNDPVIGFICGASIGFLAWIGTEVVGLTARQAPVHDSPSAR